MSKSIFESQDTNVSKTIPREKKEKYQGPEARRYIRRVLADRRAEVRFEINTTNRRQNAGRRSDDIAVSFY
jgi:hypothetical protein